jgi:ATPase family protein associated with various cellular activities (AAA)/winged helix domain-containing protein
VTDFLQDNQEALGRELERIAAALQAHADGKAADSSEPWAHPPVLEALVATFGLSPFERDVLLLCAGVELEARFAELCASAAGDERTRRPSFSLALSCLFDPHWSAIAPGAPLRFHRLVELDQGESAVTGPLRIAERVLHHLAGIDYLDERLQGFVFPVVPGRVPASQDVVAAGIAACLATPDRPPVVLGGGDATSRRATAAAGCARLGLSLHTMPATDVPAHAGERDGFARLWRREAALGRSALLVEIDDDADADVRRNIATLADTFGAPLIVGARDPLTGLRRPAVRLDVPRLRAEEQRAIWSEALGPRAAVLNGSPDVLVSHFDLDQHAIVSACVQAADTPDAELEQTLWDACRRHARPRLDDLAQRIDALAGWDDLVLPEPELGILREITLHVRGRARVYDEWGFAGKSTRGLGISALFEGPSGTGKTMAAEVLAHELRLDLYRIDLSQVVSKYIGETEKNLRRVFDAADTGGAILLFDEADALFGKRSEVKDSHDRYANIEVGYLLQRIEAYRGLAVLTTNRSDDLDEAFLRRIRFVVRFPFPAEEERREIWRRVFPAEAPVSGIDDAVLAGLSLPGGNIRNVALFAAFLAADEDAPIGMGHIARGAATECAKLERPLTEPGVREWL